jgi:hypothetical protein
MGGSKSGQYRVENWSLPWVENWSLPWVEKWTGGGSTSGQGEGRKLVIAMITNRSDH